MTSAAILAAPARFKKWGYEHVQLMRHANTALYEQTLEAMPVCWNIVKIRTGRDTASEKTREYYPAASKWGIYGWTYYTRAAAEARFKEITT